MPFAFAPPGQYGDDTEHEEEEEDTNGCGEEEETGISDEEEEDYSDGIVELSREQALASRGRP
jgi:hypothetical protein